MVNNIPWDCTNWTGFNRHYSSTDEEAAQVIGKFFSGVFPNGHDMQSEELVQEEEDWNIIIKVLTGKERIDFKKFFELADATIWLRGHSLKLYKLRCRTTLRQNFFSIRVINEWNKLPQSVIEASSVNAFKNRLDKYWSDMGEYS